VDKDTEFVTGLETDIAITLGLDGLIDIDILEIGNVLRGFARGEQDCTKKHE